MAQLTKSISGKQRHSLQPGCYLVETAAVEVGLALTDRREYVAIMNNNAGAAVKCYYFEVMHQCLMILPAGIDYYLRQIDGTPQKWKFDVLS